MPKCYSNQEREYIRKRLKEEKLLPVKKEVDVKVFGAAFHAIYYATLHKKEIGEEGYDQALRMLIYGIVTQL